MDKSWYYYSRVWCCVKCKDRLLSDVLLMFFFSWQNILWCQVSFQLVIAWVVNILFDFLCLFFMSGSTFLRRKGYSWRMLCTACMVCFNSDLLCFCCQQHQIGHVICAGSLRNFYWTKISLSFSFKLLHLITLEKKGARTDAARQHTSS